MFKKTIIRTVVCAGLFFGVQQNCFAQDKTKDEVKAEREVLKSEMKSKDVIDRKAKFKKLVEPKTSGISSVDGLAANTTKMLVKTKELNVLVPEMYKRTVGESVDGVADVTVKKPSMAELVALATNIGTQIKNVAEITGSVAGASGDVSKASMMQMSKGTKSLGYSKDVLALVGPELGLNLKVVSNLIATLKSSGNL